MRVIASGALLIAALAALIGAAWLQPDERTPRVSPGVAAAPSSPTPASTPAPTADPDDAPVPDRGENVAAGERVVEDLGLPEGIEPEPSLWREGVEPVRVTVPVAGIDGPVVLGSLDEERRQMIAPEGPSNIAWYDFSALPGEGGNAVLAGHVDYIGQGPAVLWHLRDVERGDLMQVDLSDGTRLTYRVASNEVHHVDDGPWGELFQPRTDRDLITIYTCDGVFLNGTYDARRVVQAELLSVDRPQW
jgi:LPXTG-site transpeptidase (sortase) family protein